MSTEEELKLDYITVCGPEDPFRTGTDRKINLTNFLPEYHKETDLYDLTEVFETYLNEMYTGSPSWTQSETEIDSVSANIIYTQPENVTTRYISILEKINRLTELHDPQAIDDIDHLQHLAATLGYNVNLNKGEMGTYLATDTGVCSATNLDKYLRFVVENLPTWYKIKTTRNCLKVMLFSFGIIADVSFYFTDSYLPSISGGNWTVSDYLMSADSLAAVPDNYFPTPHFIIWQDLDLSTTDLIWDTDKKQQIINAIQSIRPINTVFRNLGAYAKRNFNMFMGANTRFHRYLKISSEGWSDYWA